MASGSPPNLDELKMATAALVDIGKQLDGLNKIAKNFTGASGGGKELENSFMSIGKSLAGPVGITALLWEASKALTSFSTERVQLQNLSKDIGFSTKTIEQYTNAMGNLGISATEAKAHLSNLGSQLLVVQSRQENSPLVQTLINMGHATTAGALMKEKDTTKQMQMLFDFNRSLGPRQKIEFTNQTGVPQSVLEMTDSDIARTEQSLETNYELSKRHLELSNKFSIQFSNLMKEFSEFGVTLMVGNSEDWAEFRKHMSERHPLSSYQTMGNLGSVNPDALEGGGTEEMRRLGQEKMDLDQLGVGLMQPAGTPGGKWVARGIPSFGGLDSETNRVKADALINIEDDSNKLLNEIRDILNKFDRSGTGDKPGGGSIGSDGNPVGRRGLAEHLGINASRSGGGSAGITAPAGTPIQGEGMAAVETPDGKKLKVDARFKDNFQGFINDYYKAGGKFGPSTGTLGVRPNNASGHPIGDAIDVNQSGYGIRAPGGVTLPTETEDALAEKWGLVSGNKWKRPDTGHFGIRSITAARDALVAQGMAPEMADRITGAGGSVRGSVFTDQRTASGHSATTVPGIALPSREGLGKMYEVTTPDGRKFRLPQIDVGPAGWTGRGIDIGGAAANQMGYGIKNFPTDSQFSYRQIDEARERMDKIEADKRSAVEGNLNASIKFEGMPAWFKTVVAGDGFERLSVSRTAPQNGRAGANTSEPNIWAGYE